MVFVIQENTAPDPSTEQVKVASSPGQTHSLLGETDPFTAELVPFTAEPVSFTAEPDPPAAEPVSDPDVS